MLFNIRFLLLLSLPVLITGCASQHSPDASPSAQTKLETKVERAEASGHLTPPMQTVLRTSSQSELMIEHSDTPDKESSAPTLHLKTPRFAHASATDGRYIYVFAGYGKQGYLSDVEIINPITGEVAVLENRVLPRGYFSAVFDGQHSIYLLGGVSHQEDKVRVEQRIEVFDTRTLETRTLGDIPEPLRDNKAVYLDGYLYVLGGSSYQAENGYQLTPSASVWRYHIQQQEWQKMANMPSAKSTAVVTDNQDIYVVGGEQNTDSLANVERYTVASNTWQNMTALPHPVSAHSATWLNNALWVFSNEDETNNSYFLKRDTSRWQIAPFNYQSALYTSITSMGHSLYIIGGNGGKGNSFMGDIQVLTP
ncbi:Kelch repeat-containing protein [Paraglaciecola sp. T6c]|uniref:Kelch repeat-containing protein n=1 Tax=Pseudoalteromonas atlantica (strain T6c / ATCC BAA-1087) TaxID=3042615 RepID=UPI0005A0BFA1|nr:kelch repeat-containing protein [Paraglaciecola sp. T6c]